ncbi:hypothetical protein YTPLAS73_09520 [Nitrosarchaeum sp.]|nr:hypothetical protein YTPLAS73_09520 [Nitrosarchaeum sp.]
MKNKIPIKTLELGTRKISNMNFSKIVTLPKPFTQNYLDENMEVSMSLSHDGKLTLTPVKKLEEVKKK